MPSPLPIVLSEEDLVVSTHALSKTYKRVVALSNLALQVPAGAVYLLVGPNGAGKSTTIKILLDLIRPTSGSANLLGIDPQAEPARVRANIGYVPEQLDWGYSWMRVGRLLEHHARYYPSWDREYAKRLFKFFDLRLDQKVSTLSKGQGRRVHLTMALAHRPPVLVLDEPTDGLDPVMRDETIGAIADHLTTTPTTVLLSTHHVSEFEGIADHIGVLRDGELRAQVSLEHLRRSLRRYHAALPPNWVGAAELDDRIVRRTLQRGHFDCVVWGEEAAVVAILEEKGASVRSVVPLNLADATLALLSTRNDAARDISSTESADVDALESHSAGAIR
jgi:ABC-2 type transport system ATP-binding protein